MDNLPKEKKDNRIPLMMTDAELKAVDDWAFARRIRSRGEAIRRLVALGLIRHDEKNTAPSGEVTAHEGDS